MPAWTDAFFTWTQSLFQPRRNQLILTAFLSGATVASVILGLQTAAQFQRARSLKSSIEDSPDVHDPIADKVAEYNAQASAAIILDDDLHDADRRPSYDDTINTDPAAAPADTSLHYEQHKNKAIAEQEDEDKRNAMLAMRARNGDYDEDLILEQLARNRVFLTDNGLHKLRSAFIIIVGCGGVGSHATAALARSGVSKLRLIDFDQVTLSSLNRHAVATLADVGTPKVHCIRKRLQQIAPWVNFDCRNELFGSSTAEPQLAAWDGHRPDYVVDAIDNIDSKVELLKYCHDHSLPIISSMGAGCKSDPTRVFIGDISESTEDPLSRSTRRRLRAVGVASGIPVVFSVEKTAPGKAQLLPLPEDEFTKGKVGELGVLPDFRVRILPVLGTMPAIFGLCVANHIMLEVTGYPQDHIQSKGRPKLYDGILANLQGIEERLAKWAGEDHIGLRIPVTLDDVGYLVEEVYRGRSVVSGLAGRLTLIRWGWHQGQAAFVDKTYENQKYSKVSLNDLVCMTKEEAARHEKDVLKGDKAPAEMYEAAVIERVKARMQEEAYFSRYR